MDERLAWNDDDTTVRLLRSQQTLDSGRRLLQRLRVKAPVVYEGTVGPGVDGETARYDTAQLVEFLDQRLNCLDELLECFDQVELLNDALAAAVEELTAENEYLKAELRKQAAHLP